MKLMIPMLAVLCFAFAGCKSTSESTSAKGGCCSGTGELCKTHSCPDSCTHACSKMDK